VYRAGYLELTRIQRERARRRRGGARPLPRGERLPGDDRTTYEQVDGMEESPSLPRHHRQRHPVHRLFGTVWGIMNAFSGIATTGNATPGHRGPRHRRGPRRHRGGLAAAIPSVMAYNYFLSRIRAIHTRINSFTSEFIQRSRAQDREGVTPWR